MTRDRDFARSQTMPFHGLIALMLVCTGCAAHATRTSVEIDVIAALLEDRFAESYCLRDGELRPPPRLVKRMQERDHDIEFCRDGHVVWRVGDVRQTDEGRFMVRLVADAGFEGLVYHFVVIRTEGGKWAVDVDD